MMLISLRNLGAYIVFLWFLAITLMACGAEPVGGTSGNEQAIELGISERMAFINSSDVGLMRERLANFGHSVPLESSPLSKVTVGIPDSNNSDNWTFFTSNYFIRNNGDVSVAAISALTQSTGFLQDQVVRVVGSVTDININGEMDSQWWAIDSEKHAIEPLNWAPGSSPTKENLAKVGFAAFGPDVMDVIEEKTHLSKPEMLQLDVTAQCLTDVANKCAECRATQANAQTEAIATEVNAGIAESSGGASASNLVLAALLGIPALLIILAKVLVATGAITIAGTGGAVAIAAGTGIFAAIGTIVAAAFWACVASIVCGLAAVILLVVAGYFLYKYLSRRSATGGALASSSPVQPPSSAQLGQECDVAQSTYDSYKEIATNGSFDESTYISAIPEGCLNNLQANTLCGIIDEHTTIAGAPTPMSESIDQRTDEVFDAIATLQAQQGQSGIEVPLPATPGPTATP